MRDGDATSEMEADGRLCLAPRTIHLFTVDLGRAGRIMECLDELLPVEERAGVRFSERQPRDKRACVARVYLRHILGRCSGRDPGSLAFSREPGGKPKLRDEQRLERIRFNVAHSADLMLVAVALDIPIGIDVEELRPIDSMLSIAGYYFSDAELAELLAVRAEDRLRAFYNGWTRKEAFVKATGEGMARDFRSFDVSLLPSATPRVAAVRAGRSMEDPDAWQVFAFEPHTGYVAAVVVRGEGWRLVSIN